MLRRVQQGLERLYRIDETPQVDQFVVGRELRDALGLERSPREQLLLHEGEGELSVGLFIDEAALANLERDDPTMRLHSGNLEDFLLVVEGVSHFVYLTWRASSEKRVSALELELQAEVDKWVTCLLGCDSVELEGKLHRRLFDGFELLDDLSSEERERYQRAARSARRYAQSLAETYVGAGRIPSMLRELRRFYRLPLAGKLDHIGRYH